MDSKSINQRHENSVLSDDLIRVDEPYHFRDCACSGCNGSVRYRDFSVSASLDASLDYNDLVWDYQILDQNIGYSEEVDFSLFTGPWESTQTSSHRGDVLGVFQHTQEQQDFVVSVFERLEKIIDLDFNRVASGEGDIRLYRAFSNSSWGNRFSGGGVGGGTMYGQSAGIDLEWRDASPGDAFNEYEKSTIVHEIGHALGLQHPGGVGDNPGWDTYDSIMSYNDPNDKPINTWFTAYDIAALRSIWGAESNNSPELTGDQALLADGIEDQPYVISKVDLLSGFTDIDSSVLTIESLESSVGTIVDNQDSFLLSLPEDFNGEVLLSYQVADGDGGSVDSSNTLLVQSVNDLPVRDGSRFPLNDGKEDRPYLLKASRLLKEFTDVDSSSLRIESLTPSVGTIADNRNGSFTLTTPKDFHGKLFLDFNVVDGDGAEVSSRKLLRIKNMPDGVVRRGSKGSDVLKGTREDDTLVGFAGSDRLIAKKGDDLIDPGRYTKGKYDLAVGGKGNDVFVIKDGYWVFIKDFQIRSDLLDLSGLDAGLDWNSSKGLTFIYGSDGYEVARFKGRVNLSNAQLVA